MFDPYHKWLGIKPEVQPPTYYQLLGIAADEQDPEVIEEAAIRQTAHIRTYQLGLHAAECTKILNELAQARTNLLNPAKRKAYDAQLAEKEAAKAAPARLTTPPQDQLTAARPPHVPLVEVQAADAEEEFPEDRPRRRSRRDLDITRQSGRNTGLIVGLSVGGGVLVVVIVVLGILLARPGDGKNLAVAKQEQKGNPKQKPQIEPQKPPPLQPNPNPVKPAIEAPVNPNLVVLEDGEIRRFEGSTRPIESLAFSPDGSRALSNDGGRVHLWDVATGRSLHTWTTLQGFRCLAFSPDGRHAFLGSGYPTPEGAVNPAGRLVDLQSYAVVKQLGFASPVKCAVFLPDGTKVVTGNGREAFKKSEVPTDCVLRLWDVKTGKELKRSDQAKEPFRTIAVSPEGDRVLAHSGPASDRIYEWNLQTGVLRDLQVQLRPTGRVAFSPDCRELVALGLIFNKGARLYKLEPFAAGWESSDYQSGPRALAFSSDGKYLALGVGYQPGGKIGDDCGVRILEAKTGKMLANLKHESEVLSVAISSDNRYLLSGTAKKVIRLWDLKKVLTQEALADKGGQPRPGPVAKAPTDRRVVEGGEIRRFLGAHLKSSRLAFSPDGRRILSVGRGGVQLWDVATGQILHSWNSQINCACFSPDSKHAFFGTGILFTNQDQTSKVIDPGGQLVDLQTYAVQPLEGLKSPVLCAAFLGDGARLVTGGGTQLYRKETAIDRVFCLWDVKSRKELKRSAEFKEAITSLAVAPDGNHVVGYSKYAVWEWDLQTGGLRVIQQLPMAGRVAISSDVREILVLGNAQAKSAQLYNLQPFKRAWGITFGSFPSGLALSKNGRHAAVGFGFLLGKARPTFTGAYLFDSQTGTRLATFKTDSAVSGLAFSPDDRYLLAASETMMHLWDLDQVLAAAAGPGKQ